MILSHHQGDKLRFVYFRNGNLVSARLSQAPRIDSSSYGEHVLAEIVKSRRYLERSRQLRPGDRIDVKILTDTATSQQVINSVNDKNVSLEVVTTERIGKQMRMAKAPAGDRLEALYVLLATRFGSVNDYAPREVTRTHRLFRLRRAALAALVVVALGSAFATGANVSNSLVLADLVATMRSQTEQMEETFLREHESLAPAQAESHEMKAAVDTGDFILANRVPAELVMQELGGALDEFPEIRIHELEWHVDAEQGAASRDERDNVVLSAATGLTAELYGEIRPFDGDLRQAFATIDRLVAKLRAHDGFADVVATEYPVDARPSAAVSGELVGSGNRPVAPFRLRMRMTPDPAVANADEA